MMFKKKLLASAMATALVTGIMVSGGAQAIRISEQGDGQVLMGPLYMAMAPASGVVYNNTRVRVVNSSLTNAVKAKVVFRSKKHSDECFDAILYLTPGDVAYMDVRVLAGSTNNAQVWSDDDSLLASRDSAGNIKFASQISGGVTWTMTAPRTEPTADSCAMGHIEVVGAYAVSGTVAVPAFGTTPATNIVVKQGMSKFDLIRIFDVPKANLNAVNTNATLTNVVSDGANHASRVQLKGMALISRTDGGDRISVPMTALRDGTTPNVAVSNNSVITNPTFDVVVGQETVMGGSFLAGAVSDALVDIENALSETNSSLYGFYENSNNAASYGIGMGVTLPTKYRHLNGQYTAAWAYNAPFTTKGLFNYGVTLYDNQENSAPAQVSPVCIVSPCPVNVVTPNTMDMEVNYFSLTGSSTWQPTSGWVNLTMTPGAAGATDNTVGFGIPAIGYLHYYEAGVTRSVIDTMSR